MHFYKLVWHLSTSSNTFDIFKNKIKIKSEMSQLIYAFHFQSYFIYILLRPSSTDESIISCFFGNGNVSAFFCFKF